MTPNCHWWCSTLVAILRTTQRCEEWSRANRHLGQLSSGCVSHHQCDVPKSSLLPLSQYRLMQATETDVNIATLWHSWESPYTQKIIHRPFGDYYYQLFMSIFCSLCFSPYRVYRSILTLLVQCSHRSLLESTRRRSRVWPSLWLSCWLSTLAGRSRCHRHFHESLFPLSRSSHHRGGCSLLACFGWLGQLTGITHDSDRFVDVSVQMKCGTAEPRSLSTPSIGRFQWDRFSLSHIPHCLLHWSAHNILPLQLTWSTHSLRLASTLSWLVPEFGALHRRLAWHPPASRRNEPKTRRSCCRQPDIDRTDERLDLAPLSSTKMTINDD